MRSNLAAIVMTTFLGISCATPTPITPPLQVYSALAPLDFGPAAQPAISGTWDFDVLGPVSGKACASLGERRSNGLFDILIDGKRENYRIRMPAWSKDTFGGTELEWAAASAAAFRAAGAMPDADSIVVTRSRSETNHPNVCSEVWGQAIRMKKATPSSSSGGRN